MSEEMRHPLDPIGMAAYESYRIVSNGKSLVSGQPLPPWQELPGVTREAWRAAADGAVMANSLPPMPPKWAPADWSAMLGQLHALAAKWAADAKRLDSVAQPERTPAERAVAASAETFARCARELLDAIGQPS